MTKFIHVHVYQMMDCRILFYRPLVFREPVIFLGADVTHPPAGDTSKPSIAAVCTTQASTAYREISAPIYFWLPPPNITFFVK